MPPASPSKPVPAFDLKSTAWTLTVVRLHNADAEAVGREMDRRFADSPGLFEDEPIVVDLSPLRADGAVPDLAVLLYHLRRHGMRPLAAQGGSELQMAAARAAGLTATIEPERWLDTQSPVTDTVKDAGKDAAKDADAARPAAKPLQTEPAEAAAPPVVAPPTLGAVPTLVIDKPLRSGQRVYARGSDLIVLSAVSFGAEVIADGHIHVYAPLRGRAIAGARGDTSARIFSTCLEPQLVSIAGIYRTTETPLAANVAGRAAQVRLEGESLLVEPLGT